MNIPLCCHFLVVWLWSFPQQCQPEFSSPSQSLCSSSESNELYLPFLARSLKYIKDWSIAWRQYVHLHTCKCIELYKLVSLYIRTYLRELSTFELTWKDLQGHNEGLRLVVGSRHESRKYFISSLHDPPATPSLDVHWTPKSSSKNNLHRHLAVQPAYMRVTNAWTHACMHNSLLLYEHTKCSVVYHTFCQTCLAMNSCTYVSAHCV